MFTAGQSCHIAVILVSIDAGSCDAFVDTKLLSVGGHFAEILLLLAARPNGLQA